MTFTGLNSFPLNSLAGSETKGGSFKSWRHPGLLHDQLDRDLESNRGIQTFFGYDGMLYAKWRRKELLDQKIDALEIELARLKKLRRELGS